MYRTSANNPEIVPKDVRRTFGDPPPIKRTPHLARRGGAAKKSKALLQVGEGHVMTGSVTKLVDKVRLVVRMCGDKRMTDADFRVAVAQVVRRLGCCFPHLDAEGQGICN
jgi:hypothetical protein